MTELTFEEKNLVCIYSGDETRQGTISALEDMRQYLEPDEDALRRLTDSTLRKLQHMSDTQFATLDLIPDFDLEATAYGE